MILSTEFIEFASLLERIGVSHKVHRDNPDQICVKVFAVEFVFNQTNEKFEGTVDNEMSDFEPRVPKKETK